MEDSLRWVVLVGFLLTWVALVAIATILVLFKTRLDNSEQRSGWRRDELEKLRFKIDSLESNFASEVRAKYISSPSRQRSENRPSEPVSYRLDDAAESSYRRGEFQSPAEEASLSSPRGSLYQRHESAKPAHEASLDSPATDARASIDATEIVSDYNSVSTAFSQAELDAFTAKWHPVPVRVDRPGELLDHPEGKLWFVAERPGSQRGVVLPGGEAIRTWDKFYRQLSGMNAKALLDTSYRVHEGPGLVINRPATAERQGATIKIIQEGELLGI